MKKNIDITIECTGAGASICLSKLDRKDLEFFRESIDCFDPDLVDFYGCEFDGVYYNQGGITIRDNITGKTYVKDEWSNTEWKELTSPLETKTMYFAKYEEIDDVEITYNFKKEGEEFDIDKLCPQVIEFDFDEIWGIYSIIIAGFTYDNEELYPDGPSFNILEQREILFGLTVDDDQYNDPSYDAPDSDGNYYGETTPHVCWEHGDQALREDMVEKVLNNEKKLTCHA